MSEVSDRPKRSGPRPVGLHAEFYEYCAKGELRFQRCVGCRAWRHLPRVMCAKCGSPRWHWERASGHGRIFSWTVTHRPPHPALAAEVPYAAVVVEMEEGVRLVSRLRGLAPEKVELELPVEVEFEELSDGFTLPVFRPVPAR